MLRPFITPRFDYLMVFGKPHYIMQAKLDVQSADPKKIKLSFTV